MGWLEDQMEAGVISGLLDMVIWQPVNRSIRKEIHNRFRMERFYFIPGGKV
jgi:hypothetical protein